MKKNIIWLSVLSFFCGLSGCSEQEDEGPGYVGNEIRIATHIGAVTRGEGVINPSLTGDLEVGFVRLDEGENYTAGKKLTGSISEGTTNKVLTFNPPQYYSSDNDDKVRLVGWYPNVTTPETFPGDGIVTFDIDGETDIMVTEMVSGSKSESERISNITFNHVLSQVIVKVYAEEDAQDEWGEITSVAIKEKKQKCTLTLPNVSGIDGEVGEEPCISFEGVTGDLQLKEIGDLSEYEEGSPSDIGDLVICGYAMFAPTQGASEDLIIQVNTVQGSLSATVPSYNFERGKKYVITLKLNADGVEEPEIPEPTDATFFITGYENKTITVTLADIVKVEGKETGTYVNEGTTDLKLNEKGEGSIYIGDKVIKTIQAEGASEILIGRRKSKPDENIAIKLNVNKDHFVYWRWEGNKGTTALVNTMAEMKKLDRDSALTYKFESDIDLMSLPWTPYDKEFTKTVDGDHHKIYNLSVTSATTNATLGGLFLTSSSASIIKHLHIVSGMFNYTGGGSNYKGVFVGDVKGGTIEGCSNAVDVNATGASVGGICGRLTGGKVIACVNKGNISSNDRGVAGICGYLNNSSAEIIACYNTGIISNSDDSDVCGIAGRLASSNYTISACYNTGKINKSTAKEGAPIAGTLTYVKDCFSVSSGTVTGTWPTTDSPSINWGLGNGSVTGNYWSSLGTPGTTNYPKLYWE
ncbi:hypothetical protein EZS27_003926 [termite gut metagenome]|uniref:GLUG domain-containing protein n=1 Tax=termite gut metagenome TaxID=433724 RepID=A0A5J4SRE8_9ZZZZ